MADRINYETECPSQQLLELMLDSGLDESESARVSDHVDRCADCQRRLDALTEAGSGYDERRILRKIGLRLENWRDPERAVLFVTNNDPDLKSLFAGERWERGSWPTALRYLDELRTARLDLA